MTSLTERNLGYGFGLLGGLLIFLGGLAALVLGAAQAILGHPNPAVSMVSEAIVLFVLGGLAVFFAYLGSHGWKDHALTTGILLVIIALLGWGLFGIGSSLLALVGGIFVFLSGVLYLVEPTRRVVSSVAAAA
jgi:hypothetical protein